MQFLSALLSLVIISYAAANSCSLSGPIGSEVLTNVWDDTFSISINRCGTYLFQTCKNPSRWSAYMDPNKVITFKCNGQSQRLGVGDAATMCGTTISYETDSINIDYDEPIGVMCGLCTSTSSIDSQVYICVNQ